MEESLPIGEFKTHCYKLLETAYETNQTLIITRRGEIIAKIIPVNQNAPESILGLMQGKAELQNPLGKRPGLEWEKNDEQ